MRAFYLVQTTFGSLGFDTTKRVLLNSLLGLDWFFDVLFSGNCLVFQSVKSFFVGGFDIAHNLITIFIEFIQFTKLEIFAECRRLNKNDSAASPMTVPASFLGIRDPVCFFAFDIKIVSTYATAIPGLECSIVKVNSPSAG